MKKTSKEVKTVTPSPWSVIPDFTGLFTKLQEQLAAIEASLDPMIDVLEKIRAVPLENSDEPYSIFRPYRKDRK